MDRFGLSDRVRAGGIHLGICALVALFAMALIFLVWYPGSLSKAQGVDRLVLIMIIVDVIIGPLITTIVFVRGKKGLRLDLTAIAALQLLALGYGLKTIHDGRPVYVVFNVDRFDVVASAEVDRESLSRIRDSRLSPSHFGPRWVAARLPDDPEKRNALLLSAVGGGPDLPQLPEYFLPLEEERSAMLKRLHPLSELRKLNALGDAQWGELIAGLGRAETEMGYLPMRANARDGAVVMDGKTGALLGIRMLTPRFEAPERGR